MAVPLTDSSGYALTDSSGNIISPNLGWLMTSIPIQMARRRLDAQNPTLVPNLSVPVSSGKGTLDVMGPTDFLTKFPRTSSSVNATIGGTVTAGNTVALTLTWGIVPNGAVTWTYTVVTGDTLETIAAGLINLINANSTSQEYGVTASSGGEAAPDEIVLELFGPAGNGAVLSYTSAGTETVTLSPSNGTYSGATGPIIPLRNFQMGWNGTMVNFWYGVPVNVGDDMITAMVKQGLPII